MIGRDDGVTRHIATSGRTTFERAKAVDFIGAAIDVTAQRRTEAAIRASEAQFRSFAEHSSSLIWIGDPAAGKIIYRSGAFERIWGMPRDNAPTALAEWMDVVHPDDRQHVERALATVRAGEVAQYEYRIVRPADGTIRWLRDISFPIRDEYGAVTRIGGIAEDLTPEDERQIYVVSAKAAEARRLVALVRSTGYRARIFESASAFLDIAPVLAPGCVLVDLRGSRLQSLAIPRELKARSIALPTIVLDGPAADVASAVAAMKAGAIDYLTVTDDELLRSTLANAMAECQGAARPMTRDEKAASRVARLTPREREVLRSSGRGRHQQDDRAEARHQSSHGGIAPRPGDAPPQREQPHRASPDRFGGGIAPHSVSQMPLQLRDGNGGAAITTAIVSTPDPLAAGQRAGPRLEPASKCG